MEVSSATIALKLLEVLFRQGLIDEERYRGAVAQLCVVG